MKGKSIIELRDERTGKIETYVDQNLVTNGFKVFPGTATHGICQIASYASYPLWANWFSGIRLFENALEEDPDKFIYKYSEPITGYAAINANTGDPKRGLFNLAESGVLDDRSGIRLVWDFSSSQANGTISCISVVPHVFVEPDTIYTMYYPMLCSLRSNGYAQTTKGIARGQLVGSANYLLLEYDEHNGVAYFIGEENKNGGTIKVLKCALELFKTRITSPWALDILEEYTINVPEWQTSTSEKLQYFTGDEKEWHILNWNVNNIYTKEDTYLLISVNKATLEVRKKSIVIPYQNGVPRYHDVVRCARPMLGRNLCVCFKNGQFKMDVDDPSKIVQINMDGITTSKSRIPCMCDNGELLFQSFFINADGIPAQWIGNLNLYDYSRLFKITNGIFASDSWGVANEYRIDYLADTRILYTINNLGTPIIKTADKAMKITYILTEN